MYSQMFGKLNIGNTYPQGFASKKSKLQICENVSPTTSQRSPDWKENRDSSKLQR